MKLSTFIRERMDLILEEWEQTAEGLFESDAAELNRAALLDHAKDMLEFIAANIEQPQTEMERVAKSRGRNPCKEETGARSHGTDRLEWGFSLDQVIIEYRALRTGVTRLWGKEQNGLRTEDIGDLVRFNEAMDQALSEAVASYSVKKEQQTRLFETMLSSSPDQSYIVNTDGQFMYANKSAAIMFGHTVKALLRMRIVDLDIPTAEEWYDRVRKVVETGRPHRGELSIPAADGKPQHYEYVHAPILDQAGRVNAVAGAARNVTERRAAEYQIWRSANFDPLTGVPNRRLFSDRLEQALKNTQRRNTGLTLLFLDLDGFKGANDRLGHDGGDLLLQQVAKRIRTSVREADTVARLGGDEFVVILKDIQKTAEAAAVADKILSEIERPLRIADRDVRISASLGIALAPRDGSDNDELMRKADHAMYAAKADGGNRARFYDYGRERPA